MDRDFWLDKWAKGITGFHREQPNPALIAHIDRLGLAPGARVFLPLCGKTRDIGWLLGQGYRVCGVEFSALAVDQLFGDLEIVPTQSEAGALVLYRAPGLDLFVGDIFDLGQGALGSVDAIYDRAALVALPEGMRGRYAGHLTQITDGAAQLLVCCDYDQNAMAGPPFSVDEAQVREFYAGTHDLTILAREAVPGGLKGQCEADQFVWLLKGKERR